MRLDLQTEARRLARVLCDLLPSEPEVFGLYALVAFSLARAATRTDERGEFRFTTVKPGPAPGRQAHSRRASWMTSWKAFVDVQYRTIPAGNV